MSTQSNYTKTFTSFSGADIVAMFGEKVIGELQAITYSVTREKAPIYTMGDANPRSFSRGKRGIAGSLVFTVFDRDSMHMMKQDENVQVGQLNQTATQVGEIKSIDELSGQNFQQPIVRRPVYTDEVPPFDVTINFMNEYGQTSVMTIYGVEILNEGMGMSIDDITTEKACTFIARAISDMNQENELGY
jgi:hypothetical protein